MTELNPLPPGAIAVGRCSICGGLVTSPQVWHGVIPPPQTCMRCGAVAAPADPYKDLPVIPMQKPPVYSTQPDGTGNVTHLYFFENTAGLQMPIL